MSTNDGKRLAYLVNKCHKLDVNTKYAVDVCDLTKKVLSEQSFRCQECREDFWEAWDDVELRTIANDKVLCVNCDPSRPAPAPQPAPLPAPDTEGKYAEMFRWHILNRWSYEQIKLFCLHLLGDAYQERDFDAEKLARLVLAIPHADQGTIYMPPGYAEMRRLATALLPKAPAP